jgi:uncharacterized RDD family membrane protein YckC
VTAPDKLSIDTPEQVALEFPLAGVGSRFLALAVDTILQVAGGLLLALAMLALWRLLSLSIAGTGTWIGAASLVALFLIYYGYFAAFEALWQGQTPGKRLVGLRVIGESGRPARTEQVLVRNLLRIVDQIPGIYGVGMLSVLVTSRNQRLGDLTAGTVVVRERTMEVLSEYDEGAASAHSFGVRLTDDEAALVAAFLRRRRELDVFVRERRAADIASRLRQRLGSTVNGSSDEDFLESVLADHRRAGRYR